MKTRHYFENRNQREELISKIGNGTAIEFFYVDRKHRDGAERHVVTDTGIIIIYNEKTNRLVTKLIARPNQIKRYYDLIGAKAPQYVMEIAERHKMLGYNEI